jgi:Bacterial archaeo-eukaryotic release factor family 2
MDTTYLAPLFQVEGPFATVHVDVSRDSENGAHEHELRVRAASERLSEQDADPAVVEQVARVLSEVVDRPNPVARLVVANREGIQLDETAALRLEQTVATWGPLPDLTSWITHRDSAVTFVLAVVDHEGGNVTVHSSEVPDAEQEESVGGEERFVHKVPVGGWSALRYQRTTENVWARNAAAVVEAVTSHVRSGHRLVLLAGDPRSRGMVRDGLADLTGVELVELETGTRSADGGDEALQQAIREALLDHVVARRVALAHELRDRLGQDRAVATGVRDVAEAFVRGQVETLLLDPVEARTLELEPTRFDGLVLGPATSGPVPADLALVAAAAQTSAQVAVTHSAALAGAPVAALLRWDQ